MASDYTSYIILPDGSGIYFLKNGKVRLVSPGAEPKLFDSGVETVRFVKAMWKRRYYARQFAGNSGV